MASSLCLFFAIISLPVLLRVTVTEASSCGGPCQALSDCVGRLICINGKCDDDPQFGAHTCGTTRRRRSCHSNGPNSPTFVPSGTPAVLTLNNFGASGYASGPPKCDRRYHPLPQQVVALSTGWYNGGSRCGKKIRITTRKGRSTVATVVSECDSVHGCDKEHASQPPCRTNIVDASETVWNKLRLDTEKGEVAITWSMA